MQSILCCTSQQPDNEHVEEKNGQRIEQHQHSIRETVLDKDHLNLISEKEKNYSNKEYDKPLIDEKFIREEEKPHITFVIIRNIKSIKKTKNGILKFIDYLHSFNDFDVVYDKNNFKLETRKVSLTTK